MKEFDFEGKLYKKASNIAAISSVFSLKEAMLQGTILEGLCYMCDSEHNLYVKLGECVGIIPKSEGALGIDEGKIRDIALISKVGKRVQFVVESIDEEGKTAFLSRKKVQQRCRDEYIKKLVPGDVLEAKVTHLEPFGAFVDIGAGINSLIPIDMLSVSRIPHPSQRVHEGEVLRCVVKNKSDGKITLSLREMLGTWEENAARFRAGQTVRGIVRSIESYGVFIELAPNLAGLAEFSNEVEPGQEVAVFIKAIIPEKMKIKLSIIDSFEQSSKEKLTYYFEGDHMDRWRYSPDNCLKTVETVF